MDKLITITKDQYQVLVDTIDACGVFITPLEHRKGWNDYKQDAQNKLNESKIVLAQIKLDEIVG